MAAVSSTSRWEPTARWASRHREVVDAAATAFAEKGFLGASTRDIADSLGIRAASLYYYLPSKDAALAAVCELGVREFIENLRGIFARKEPAADKLRAAVANHLAPLRARPAADYIRVFLRHRHELADGPRQSVAKLAAQYQSLIEQIFVEGVSSGQFRAGLNPKLATLALLGLCNSVIGARKLPRGCSIDDFIAEYSKIAIQGVSSGDTTRKPRRKNRNTEES
jgi:TetR/AcrR family transcriptional regulator, cholesterol catabolism regulator